MGSLIGEDGTAMTGTIPSPLPHRGVTVSTVTASRLAPMLQDQLQRGGPVMHQ